ncbi:MAG TPA: hypothetical protein VLX85_03375 [Stellaceae bacterium]|nr:hypothetical protein [Stellaceae bacterium]
MTLSRDYLDAVEAALGPGEAGIATGGRAWPRAPMGTVDRAPCVGRARPVGAGRVSGRRSASALSPRGDERGRRPGVESEAWVEPGAEMFPGERLIVCRNGDLAAERARKREELLVATERELSRVEAQVRRKHSPLRGAAEIGMAVGAVLDGRKMGKHFAVEIRDSHLSWRRRIDEIEAEARLDGIYVIRTSMPAEHLDAAETVQPTKIYRGSNAPSGRSRPSTSKSGRSATGPLPGSAPTPSCVCSPIMSNAKPWRRSCSMTPISMLPVPSGARRSPRPNRAKQ